MQLFFQTRAGTWSSCDRGLILHYSHEGEHTPGCCTRISKHQIPEKANHALHCIEYNIILKSVQLKAHNLNDRKITFSS